MEGKTTHVSLCRPASAPWLAEELRGAGATVPAAPAGAPAEGAGWLAWQSGAGGAPRAALVFERQRLPDAAFLAGEAAGALAEALCAAALPALAAAEPPQALHVFAADPTGERSLSGRAARLERALERAWAAAHPASHAALLDAERFAAPARGGTVWQVCVVEGGAWWALTPRAALADPWPGGVHRMTRDAQAPSRSVLKIEEALDRLAAELGATPRPRERVIDLGAAPGGWSYAFLRRGCRVLAVDNGPLKLRGLDALPGELTHLRADGLRLRPPPGWLPADWLLSDMLVAPGVCLGLLRKWIEGGWMRRFIVNVKLPQRDAPAALRPLRDYLAGVPGLAWRMRQLYHDRREVTVLGELAALAQPAAARPVRERSTPRPRRRPGAAGRPGASPPRRTRRPGRGRRRS